jgi:hypothetical protein
MWGGTTYTGVDAKYYQHPLQNPYEIIFSYNEHTLTPGTVLWNVSSTNTTALTPFAFESQALTTFARRFLPAIITMLGASVLLAFLLARRNQRQRKLSPSMRGL